MTTKILTLVSRVSVKRDLETALNKAVNAIGGIGKFVCADDHVLVKGNFNSADRYPASSDMAFIRSVVMMLRAYGVRRITLGASCGLAWQPTSKVLKKKKVHRLATELDIRVCNFDEEPWVPVPIDGRYLKEVRLAKSALEADKILYLPNIKTHRLAGFSMSLKFPVGLTEPSTRWDLHRDHLIEKIADINLAVKPDLILIDGRTCLVTKGPATGKRKKAKVILAGTDRVAIDVEAVKIIQQFNADNHLHHPVWNLPQIIAAKALNLGAQNDGDYEVISVNHTD